MNIGIIGGGAIAQFLLQELHTNNQNKMTVTSIFVRNKDKYLALETQYGVTVYSELDKFLLAPMDVVVEAASVEAVNSLLPILIKHKPVVAISVGAFVEEELQQLIEEIQNDDHTLYLPSGAIGGLDLLQNIHALNGVESIQLTTRKPAQSLDISSDEEVIIFEGSAKQAIQQFPKNMNVSIVLALAGLGFEQTKVKLIADPTITQNIHQIEIMGEFGEAIIQVKNNPLPRNPKTSYLAALSIVGTLKRIGNKVVIG